MKDICGEARISRAAFYAHFTDKYDFLKNWLLSLKQENDKDGTYEQMEKTVNKFIHKNEIVIRNLVCDADNEALNVIFKFMLSTLNLTIEKNENVKINPKYIILSNFYAGGMTHYLLWLAKAKFPPDITPMNKYLYEIIENLRNWDTE